MNFETDAGVVKTRDSCVAILVLILGSKSIVLCSIYPINNHSHYMDFEYLILVKEVRNSALRKQVTDLLQ